MKHKLIVLALVFSLVIVSQNTFSLGMGKIQVNSALDEPLNANIDIIANNDESIEQVSVKLASADDYKKVGLDKSFVPAHIMVSVDEDNPYQINVSSHGPVSEPIVSLLLDVTWANGRILREFTLLLDPPSYQASTRGSVTMPVTQPQQPDTLADVQDDAVMVQSDDIPPVSQDLNEAYEEMDATVSVPEQDETEFVVETPMDENISESLSIKSGEVYVNAGDTLWGIANQNRPSDVTTHQMMMAIYEKNPQAFLNNNINEMVKGSTLQMPDADSVDDLSYAEALAAFESHNSRWAAAEDRYSSFQTESQPDEQQTVADSIDYGVQLSGGEGDDTDSQQTEGDLADSGDSGISDEEAFNISSENEELKSRVSELENIVDEQQSVLELQDDDMANLENQMAQATTEGDSLTEGDFDSVDTEDVADDVSSDDTSLDDVWDTEVADDSESMTDDDMLLADDISEQDTDLVEDEALAMVDDSSEADLAVEPPVISTPKKPVSVSEPWYTSAINWIQQNVLWVIIGLVVLFLIVLLPRVFNRGDEDPAEESSFLDDIKSSRGKQEDLQKDLVESDDHTLEEDDGTVLTTPVSVDDESDDDSLFDEQDDLLDDEATDDDSASEDSDDEDVLAELDNSLAFDDNDDDSDDEFDFNFDDDEDSIESKALTDDDAVDDLSYETPTKEYDPAPFRDDDSFEDDFDLSDLDDDSLDDDKLDDDTDELDSEASVETSLFDDDDFDLDAELSQLDDELDTTDMDSDQSDDETDDDQDDDFAEDDFLADLDELDNFDDDANADDDAVGELDEQGSDDDEFAESISLDEDDQATTFATDDDEDDMDDDIDLGLDDLMDEGDVIETKLDLAKAYIEMGDTEGAKNLLDEVKAEGNDAQQSEANKLLDDM